MFPLNCLCVGLMYIISCNIIFYYICFLYIITSVIDVYG